MFALFYREYTGALVPCEVEGDICYSAFRTLKEAQFEADCLSELYNSDRYSAGPLPIGSKAYDPVSLRVVIVGNTLIDDPALTELHNRLESLIAARIAYYDDPELFDESGNPQGKLATLISEADEIERQIKAFSAT